MTEDNDWCLFLGGNHTCYLLVPSSFQRWKSSLKKRSSYKRASRRKRKQNLALGRVIRDEHGLYTISANDGGGGSSADEEYSDEGGDDFYFDNDNEEELIGGIQLFSANKAPGRAGGMRLMEMRYGMDGQSERILTDTLWFQSQPPVHERPGARDD